MPGSYQLVELLVAGPVHLLVLAAGLVVLAFRSRGRLRRWRGLLLLLLAWTWVSGTPWFAHALVNWLEDGVTGQPVAGEAPLIVVLAAGDPWFPGNRDALQLNLASQRRTVCAVELWRERGGQLLFLGSIRGEKGRAVSERMADLAAAMGVPPASLAAVPGSLNTFQNLQDVPATGRPLVLVTSAMHMRRALAVAGKRGLEMTPLACDFRGRKGLGLRAFLPDAGAMPMFSSALHEILGYLYYWGRGWL